jgi:hypothetical protein
MRMGKSTSDYALQKAKEILDELRRRAGEARRPELERDYIDRLLKECLVKPRWISSPRPSTSSG